MYIYGQKSFSQVIKKKVFHISIILMVKFSRQLAYNGGKKEGLSKEYDKEGNIITLLEYNNDFLISREKINRTDSKGIKTGKLEGFLSER